jgi:apolipoprotein N-acyltransferase
MADKYPKAYLTALSLMAGLLLGGGFVWAFTWPVVVLGIALLIFLITKAKNFKEVLLIGFFTFLTKALLVIFWFWSVYPIRWLDLALGSAELPLIGFYWLTVSLFIAVGGITLTITFWLIKNKINVLVGFLLFPPLLVLSEVLGAVSFSFFTFGPGSSLNTLYSFGSLGYLFGYSSSFISLANFGGVYILSFFLAALGYLLWLVFYYFNFKKGLVFGLCLIIILGTSSFSSDSEKYEMKSGNLTVAIVDTKFGEDFFQRNDRDIYKLGQITQAVEAALELNPDYIILPEDSRFTPNNLSPEQAYRFFRFQNSDPETVLIDSGSFTSSQGETYLRSTIYDGVGKKSWVADKQYLVPQGEYLPYFYSGTLKVIGMKEAEKTISERLPFRPGPMSSQEIFEAHIPAILFCFEGANPLSVRRFVGEREVPFVAHLVSHSWFHESKILSQQLDNMLKIQAVWNQVPLVSAGNMSRGALYTTKGNKIQKTPVYTGESWEVSVFEW